eukprot:919143-Lingulodinium_polyedra.AAC.1
MANHRKAAERSPQCRMNGPGMYGDARMGGDLKSSGVAGDEEKVVKPESLLDPHGQPRKVIH